MEESCIDDWFNACRPFLYDRPGEIMNQKNCNKHFIWHHGNNSCLYPSYTRMHMFAISEKVYIAFSSLSLFSAIHSPIDDSALNSSANEVRFLRWMCFLIPERFSLGLKKKKKVNQSLFDLFWGGVKVIPTCDETSRDWSSWTVVMISPEIWQCFVTNKFR